MAKRKGGLAGANLCNLDAPKAEPARPLPKCTTETRYVVDYGDFEDYIRDMTGHAVNIACMEETGNDTSIDLTVSAEIDDYDMKKWEKFKADGKEPSFGLRAILNGLCSEGKLLPGDYLINICW
jgi:hypothetical protein